MSYNDEIERIIFENIINSYQAGDLNEHQYWILKLKQWKELRGVNE